MTCRSNDNDNKLNIRASEGPILWLLKLIIKFIFLSIRKASILDKYIPYVCLNVVSRYTMNWNIVIAIFAFSGIPSVRRKKQIAHGSLTNRARTDLKKTKWSLEKSDPGGYRFEKRFSFSPKDHFDHKKKQKKC